MKVAPILFIFLGIAIIAALFVETTIIARDPK